MMPGSTDRASLPLVPPAAAGTVVRLSHRGLCVSDLERSSRYYETVFGFRPQTGSPASTAGPGTAKCRLRRLVNAQGVVLELRQPVDPPGIGERSRRPMTAR